MDIGTGSDEYDLTDDLTDKLLFGRRMKLLHGSARKR